MRAFEPRPTAWWREQGITRFVAGVFEGGGAKGVLYRGALEAMVEDPDKMGAFDVADVADSAASKAGWDLASRCTRRERARHRRPTELPLMTGT